MRKLVVLYVGFEGNSGVKARKQGSTNKRNVIVLYLAHLIICVLNIALLHFPLLLNPCFLAFYTTIAFKSYIQLTFS